MYGCAQNHPCLIPIPHSYPRMAAISPWEIPFTHMGITAENIAREYNISREDQDELGAESHHRALKAVKDGLFKDEIVPVEIPQRKGPPVVFDTDERPMDTTVEKMGKLRPAFSKDGTVTAGNASGINDAAAAVLLTSREFAEKNGLPIRATIKGYASGGVDPQYMGLGPVPARGLENCFGASDIGGNCMHGGLDHQLDAYGRSQVNDNITVAGQPIKYGLVVNAVNGKSKPGMGDERFHILKAARGQVVNNGYLVALRQ